MDTIITAQDLLDLLPIVAAQKWKIDGSQFIRNDEGRCPLCALVHEIDPKISAHWTACAAFRSLGYVKDPYFIGRMMDAADIPSHPLRPALLQALGMVK